MTGTYETIVISVLSGVITSVVVFSGVRFFEKVLVAWFRQITYRGIEVAGSWFWRSHGAQAKLEIKQFANKISGIYTYVPPDDDDENGATEIKIYTVSGEIKDRFVQLTMNSADPKRLGVLSYVLEVVGDGNELRGCCIFYATNNHEISSESESLFRSDKKAKSNDGQVREDSQEDYKPKESTAISAPN